VGRVARRLALVFTLLAVAAVVIGSRGGVLGVLVAVAGMYAFTTFGLVVAGLLVARRLVHRWLPPRAHPSSVPAGPPDWSEVHRRFAGLRAEYAAHECDPLAVLRLPALTDVRTPSTARFVDAFAEAQALDTDQRPPPAHAAAYAAAVDRACRAWWAARDAADRIRLAGLSPDERSCVDRVVKLLTMAADTGHEAERLTAYARAREELVRLERTGAVTMPRPARVALDESLRGRLPA
jgi:hypothetical protein